MAGYVEVFRLEFFGFMKGEGVDGTVSEVGREGSERMTASALWKAGMSQSLWFILAQLYQGRHIKSHTDWHLYHDLEVTLLFPKGLDLHPQVTLFMMQASTRGHCSQMDSQMAKQEPSLVPLPRPRYCMTLHSPLFKLTVPCTQGLLPGYYSD